jgi:hypothetical protein
MIMDAFFPDLLKVQTIPQIQDLIERISGKVKWVPLGGDPQNFPRITSASKPFDGITERITNSIDAMIESYCLENKIIYSFKTPREAIEHVYKLNDGNLKNADSKLIGELASNIKVKFVDSEDNIRPTIEIIDRGIGQHPTQFHKTLCAINSDYKAKKFYLIGAFGQGGQTSFAHCRYGIIISRKHKLGLDNNQDDSVGWTIVRYNDPSTDSDLCKYGLYEYCIDSKTGIVPIINPRKLPIAFENGTLIRLISYDLGGKGTSDVLQPAGTAWSYLSQSLFDPPLPIRLCEERSRFEQRSRSLSGLAPRLWDGGRGEKVNIKNNSYLIDWGHQYGHIKINYWLIKPIKEEGIRAKWNDMKKGYVSGSNAIFITLNGQRHGVESSSFLRDKVKLEFSFDYIIVQIDCDQLSNTAKKELLTSTREYLREGELKDKLLNEVANYLRNDRIIMKFENDRKREILTAKTEKDTSKIRQMVGKMVAANPELTSILLKSSEEKIEGEKTPHEPTVQGDDDESVQENELNIPQLNAIPTYIRITNKKNPIEVEKGGIAHIRIEIDATDEYLEGNNHGRFRAFHRDGMTIIRGVSKLRDGKLSYYIHCPSVIRVGSKEKIRFELDLPNAILDTQCEVMCRQPIERKIKKSNAKLKEPNIQCVNKDDALWNELDYDEQSVGEIRMASSIGSAIIVSLENQALQAALQSKNLKESYIETVKDRYSASIAYYLMLRYVEKIKGKIKDDDEFKPDTLELQRLAKTVALLALPLEAL